MKIIDLSTPIDDLAPEPFPVQVTRIGHEEGAERVGEKFPGEKKIGGDAFPGGMLMMMLVDSREYVIDETN